MGIDVCLSICYFVFSATGKLVEEDEGNFALWLSYILTGVGANLVSWLVLPRNTVSVGASGAVFGLFTISVLVKVPGIVFCSSFAVCGISFKFLWFYFYLIQMSWDWRKILELLILGQFVIEKVGA